MQEAITNFNSALVLQRVGIYCSGIMATVGLTTGDVDHIEEGTSILMLLSVSEELLQMVYCCATVIIRGSEYFPSSSCSSLIVYVCNRPSVTGLDVFDSTLGWPKELNMTAQSQCCREQAWEKEWDPFYPC